jgi:hypothetical protein
MSNEFLPRRDAILLEWAQSYSAQITANPTSLGLTAPIAVTLAGLVAGFQSALSAATSMPTRGPSTVFAKNEARRLMVEYIRLTARQVQGTITVTDQQRTDLGLPVRGVPQPSPAPGTATSFKAALTSLGALDLSWKCANPPKTSGTMYQLFRTVDGGAMTYIGGCGSKKFTDGTVPAGASSITYHVQAVRSTSVGAWASFTVTIGTGGSASVAQAPAAKLAA